MSGVTCSVLYMHDLFDPKIKYLQLKPNRPPLRTTVIIHLDAVYSLTTRGIWLAIYLTLHYDSITTRHKQAWHCLSPVRTVPA
jgi:hypothetical protein